jgi:glycosyltransferase involved in cell wall biosynthesis
MTTCYEPVVEAGLHFARRRNIPFIIYPLTHLGAGKRPGEDALGRFYTMRHQVELVRASDAVIAQTPTEKAFYEQHHVSGERIAVVGPGINPQELTGGNRERFLAQRQIAGPIVFSISSLNYDKGTVHTIEAIRSLWRAGHDIHLVLAGAILQPFQNYLASLPQADRDRLLVLGPISDQDKHDLLAAGDVLVMPSRTDSFGIAYLEAWLYGKPVIGAQSWGVGDLIEHGRDGVLVPFGDVAALAQAILRLVTQPELASQMGARGRDKTLRQHTWDIKYPLVRDVYRQLAESQQAG